MDASMFFESYAIPQANQLELVPPRAIVPKSLSYVQLLACARKHPGILVAQHIHHGQGRE
jgi:hypothetical protein